MQEVFIQGIEIKSVRHLKDLFIPISVDERKHLIFTGKNGSGKTSVLKELKAYLNREFEQDFYSTAQGWKESLEDQKKYLSHLEQELSKIGRDPHIEGNIFSSKQNIKRLEQQIRENDNISVRISSNLHSKDAYTSGNLLIAYFDAKRSNGNLSLPKGIQKVELKPKYTIDERANQVFIQHIVNLKAEKSFARDDSDTETIKNVDEWFERFENILKKIFNDPNIKLEFDKKNFNFNVIQNNRQKFDLTTLSDGYSAVLSIVTELILRMEHNKGRAYDMQGIVLIDEIETHLHISLQKIVLPILTEFFPKIQFIVTTHSPFVLNSIENAIIYDLESNVLVDDLSGYSIDGLVESYFNLDKYSDELKEKVEEYEKLLMLKEKTEYDLSKIDKLKYYFENLPKFSSPELALKINALELSAL